MSDLWAERRENLLKTVEPLAARMRPRTLEEFAGQHHLLASPDSANRPLLRRMIEAQGGGSLGYSLYLKDGVPTFAIRAGGSLREVRTDKPLPIGKPTHVVGILDAKGKLKLYLDGRQAATAQGFFIPKIPSDGLSIGQDTGSPVGNYETPLSFQGDLKDIRLYFGPLGEAEIQRWAGR